MGFAEFVADGDVDTEVVHVESEHSAMSATVGASAAGARAITATSANGLALMWGMVYIAASYRLPIVMPEINRALSGPINIHCDHSDTMGCRDSGWIQIYSENAQEAYDNVLQAFRIAEHKDVLLPCMVTLDGFILSHTVETIEILDDDTAWGFVGEYEPYRRLLDIDNPFTIGPLDLQNYYYEHKRQQVAAMRRAPGIVKAIGEEYGKLTGRSYGFLDEYRLDDAELVVVVLGSTAGTAQAAVDELRDQGVKAGVLKIRMFRPFPAKEIVQALSKAQVIGVMDRAISFGLEGGPVFHEIRSARYGASNPMLSIIYGLGGRDVSTDDICEVFELLQKAQKGEDVDLVTFLGVRE